MNKIKIILSGACGKLCTAISDIVSERDDCEIICGIDKKHADRSYPIYDSFDKITESADVIIDCSFHSTVRDVASYAVNAGIPVVICTTGHTDDEEEIIARAARKTAVIKSRNMSLGINLLTELVRRTAAALGEDFDIEIVEAHHRNKKDAPSGTALMLADAARSAREAAGIGSEYVFDRQGVRRERVSSEIGISSIRGGTIVGEHSVIFAGNDEVITLSHSAGSRSLFAAGAIKAAFFIADKKAGFYTMSDVIDSLI